MEVGKVFKDTYPHASASLFVCIYTLYVSGMLRQGGGGTGVEDSIQLKNGKSGWGTYTVYI